MKGLIRINMRRDFVYIIAICLLTGFLGSCTHSTDVAGTVKPVCFEKEVLPIFLTNCAISGCHDLSGEERPALTDYNSIVREVKPASLNDSRIYKVITKTWGEIMPPSPNPPLTQEQRTIIAVWIQQGANNTTCN